MTQRLRLAAVTTAIAVTANAAMPMQAGQQITLESGKQERVSVRITNECQTAQEFSVKAEPDVPWLIYSDGTSVGVGGYGVAKLPLTVSTMRSDIIPGIYNAIVAVTCLTCSRSSPACYQSRKTFPLTLIVPEQAKPPEGGGGVAGGKKKAAVPQPAPPPAPPPAPAPEKPSVRTAAGPNSARPGKPSATNREPIARQPLTREPTTPSQAETARRSNPIAPEAGTSPPAPATNPNEPTPATTQPPQPTVIPGSAGQRTENVPTPGSSNPPLLEWLLGGLAIATGIATLLRGSGKPETTADDSTVAAPQRTPARRSPAAETPGVTPDVQRQTPSQGGDQWPHPGASDIPFTPAATSPSNEPPGSWDAQLEVPASDTVGSSTPSSSSGSSDYLYDRSSTPSDREVGGTWDAALEVPSQVGVTHQGSTFTPPILAATEYMNPENGEIRPVGEDWVKLGSTPPLPGSYGGLAWPEYPPGKEPQLYVNPKTGEQQWVVIDEEDPPPGWVKRDPTIKGYFEGPGSEYMHPRTGAVVRVPDNWVKLDPTPPFPGEGGLISPHYLPGKEPRLFVDPNTGEQRWILYREKAPEGWVEKKLAPVVFPGVPQIDTTPTRDDAPKQSIRDKSSSSAPVAATDAEEKKAEPKPETETVTTAPKSEEVQDHPHTVSRGTTQADLDHANRPLSEDEKARLSSDDGTNEYAERERILREGMFVLGGQRDAQAKQDEFVDKNIEKIREKVAAESKIMHYTPAERARREERLKQMKDLVARAEKDSSQPIDLSQFELDLLEKQPVGLIVDKLARDKFLDFLKKSIDDYERDLAQDAGSGFLTDKAKMDNWIAEKQKDRDAFVKHFDGFGDTVKSFFGGLWDWADGGKLDTYKNMRARRDLSDDANSWRKKESINVLYAHRKDIQDRIAKGETGLEWNLAVAQYQIDLYEQTKKELRDRDAANKQLVPALNQIKRDLAQATSQADKDRLEAEKIYTEDTIRKNDEFIAKYQIDPSLRVNEMNDADRQAIQDIFNGLLTSKGQSAASQAAHMVGKAAGESSIGKKIQDKLSGGTKTYDDYMRKQADRAKAKASQADNEGEIAAPTPAQPQEAHGPKNLIRSKDTHRPPRPESRPGLSNIAVADEDLRKFGEAMKPEPGYHDVLIHGNPKQGGIYLGKEAIPLSVKYIADIMRKNNYKGGPVRLISCKAGELPEGFAQQLADELNAQHPNTGVAVLAADVNIAFKPTGEVTRPVSLKPHYPTATGKIPIPPYQPLGPKPGVKMPTGTSGQHIGLRPRAAPDEKGMPAYNLDNELRKVRDEIGGAPTKTEKKIGTVAVAKTNIPGVDKSVLVGKSSKLQKSKWPWKDRGKKKEPTDIHSGHPIDHRHAEEDLSNQLHDAFVRTGKKPNQIKGTVLIHVDQRLCNACGDRYTAEDFEGPLSQLSEMYPNVWFEVSNVQNGEVIVFWGGAPTWNKE